MVSSSHFNKVFLTLAVIAVLIAAGSALTCNFCRYYSTDPKAEQVCGNKTVNCSTEYCFTMTLTQAEGVTFVNRNCASNDPNIKDCPNPDETCELGIKKHKLKSCHAACCKTDNCNNYTPSSASGVMATKFVLSSMVLVAFRLA